MEGRRRLSCGSVELQTRHGQPSVGTPIDVPEPRTVIFSGVRGILNEPEKSRTCMSQEPCAYAQRVLALACAATAWLIST